MKKTLIALAAVAASTGAMAQATISGTFDFAAVSNGKITEQASGASGAVTNTENQQTGQTGRWTTNLMTFSATEDLGGGLRATATLVQDLRGNAFAQRDHHVNLAGGFGSVRIGRFTPAAGAGHHAFAGGTANSVGSTYGLVGSSTNSNFSSGLATGSFERQDNVLQYTSPALNGFTVAVNYANNSSDKDGTANVGKTQATQTGLNIAYAAGPLSIAAGTSDRTVKREAAAANKICGDSVALTVAGAASCGTGQVELTISGFTPAAQTQRTQKGSFDYVGASYNFGVATVSGAHAIRKEKTSTDGAAYATNADIKLNAIAVAVPMGQVTLRANMYRGTDKRGTGNTDDMKLSGHQLSVTYALSKRTSLYALTGKAEMKRDGSASTQATRKETATAVGIAHSF